MGKIISLPKLESAIRALKNKKKTIVLVGGCFDILHPGHIEFLNNSKHLGDVLVVLLESDQKVKTLKGRTRPILSQENRAIILAHLVMVDYVITLPHFTSDKEYSKLVNLIKPDIIAVTIGDRLKNIKEQQAKDVGGRLVEVIERKNHSTSEITKKISSVLKKDI